MKAPLSELTSTICAFDEAGMHVRYVMGAANKARIMVDAYQLPKHISSRVSQVRQRSLHLL